MSKKAKRKDFLKKCLFITLEREEVCVRECALASQGEAEREGENLKQTPRSQCRAQCGPGSNNPGIMT